MKNIVLAEDSFLTNTSDIPLMKDMKINAMDQMDFDTPSGQVLSLEGVIGNKLGTEVISFYEDVLPQMGWKLIKSGSFSRQNDTLSITVLKNRKPAKVRFDIFLTDDR